MLFRIFCLRYLINTCKRVYFLVAAYNFTKNGILRRFFKTFFDQTDNIIEDLLKNTRFHKNIFNCHLSRETGDKQNINMCFKIWTFLKDVKTINIRCFSQSLQLN